LNQGVVLDSDFFSSFLKIDRLHLVKEFYKAEALQIPPAVYIEVRLTRFFSSLASLPSVRVTEPDPQIIESLCHEPGFIELGSGEKEAIALAKQFSGSVLLMSDNQARLWATRLGLHIVGIPTFLLACKRARVIDSKEVAAIVLDLEEKDRYRFRKDVLDLLLS